VANPIKINNPLFAKHEITLSVLPLYLNHPIISGNKAYKLKYNLQEAKNLRHKTILTFGGAFSNHIHAAAAACKEARFNAIGIIRGEETLPLNPTLSFARQCGMQLHYVDRESYRTKTSPAFLEKLQQQFGEFYLIPEGGSNSPGVQGCTEILSNSDHSQYDLICCPCGTGATLAGISLSLKPNRQALGFAALKGGEFLQAQVAQFREQLGPTPSSSSEPTANFKIITDYHFGGFAKTNPELMHFAGQFEKQTAIPLDPVYTAKMMYGIYDLAKKGFFKAGTSLLAIHTGGLQGRRK